MKISYQSVIVFKFIDRAAGKIAYYNNGVLIKHIDLSDKVPQKLFVVEALQISRQTIHTHVKSKKCFDIEGLIHSYNSSSKSLCKQRNENAIKYISAIRPYNLSKLASRSGKKFSQLTLPLGDQSKKNDEVLL